MSTLTPPTRRVPTSTRVGFGVGDFGFVLVWQGTALFLMYFYTDVMGISPVVAGTIYLAAMIWDAVTDPVFATLAERTRTRWGRYRPWIGFGAVPFGIAFALAFSTPGSLPVEPWVWALATQLLLRTCYTVVSMPYNAMQARLTSDADERTVLGGFRMIGAATGGFVVATFMPEIVLAFSDQGEAYGYLLSASIVGGFAVFALLYCAATMREPDITEDAPPQTGYFHDLAAVPGLLASNGQLVRVFAITTIGSICMGMFGKNIVYHFKYDVMREDMVSTALGVLSVLLIASTPLWVILAKRTSKRDALSLGMMISAAGYLLFFFNPSSFLPGSLVAIALVGFGTASLPVLFWTMLSDTIEYGDLKTGIRAESRSFGFATFAQKAAVGINAALLGALLGWVGFEANSALSVSTLFGMKAIMTLIPTFGVTAIWLILRGYVIDRKTHDEILARLEKRDAGQAV